MRISQCRGQCPAQTAALSPHPSRKLEWKPGEREDTRSLIHSFIQWSLLACYVPDTVPATSWSFYFSHRNLKNSAGIRGNNLTGPRSHACWSFPVPSQIHCPVFFLGDLNGLSKDVLVLWLSVGPPGGEFQQEAKESRGQSTPTVRSDICCVLCLDQSHYLICF